MLATLIGTPDGVQGTKEHGGRDLVPADSSRPIATGLQIRSVPIRTVLKPAVPGREADAATDGARREGDESQHGQHQ
jgi:hypothetical protein